VSDTTFLVTPITPNISSDKYRNKSYLWANTGNTQLQGFNEANFFVQINNIHTFPLTQTVIKKSWGVMEIKYDQTLDVQGVATTPHWMALALSQPGETTPYSKTAHNIAGVALTHSLVPNKSTGKEPSQSSGELSIAGLRRFIASGYTYTYIFLKKSRQNQKVYSITIVFDATIRAFSPLNFKHTMATTIALLESFAYIPGEEEIVLDFLLASYKSVRMVLYGVSARSVASPALLSELISAARDSAGLHSGLYVIQHLYICSIYFFRCWVWTSNCVTTG
jgi:hypothetical protein